VIVVDASAVIAVLLNSAAGRRVAVLIRPPQISLHAPQLLDVEVLQVLRRNVLSGGLTVERGAIGVEALGQLDITRYGHEELAPRIWALKQSLSAYDAAYVALAEVLNAPLLTLDARLAAAPGHQADVHLIR
jgi:predicted nucleic acid-binding protein